MFLKNEKTSAVVKKYAKRYFLDGMSAMAFGLFASLLIGTIFKALGMIPGLSLLSDIGAGAQAMAGATMAIAISYALKADPLVVYTCAGVGYLANVEGGAGGPLAVFVIAIVASEMGMLVSKKTKIDILITPFVTLLVGGALAIWTAPLIGKVASVFTSLISYAMTAQPFLMGMAVSALIGIALTLPISSAAICATLCLSGMGSGDEGLALAGGAAVAGCCAQMIGFATLSYSDNGIGGLVSQGLGTSMLQMPNILKNPKVWIPPIVASLITGPMATCLFRMKMYSAAINSGMGTCGMLGPIGIILGWFGGEYPDTVGAFDWVGLVLICFVLPVVICLLLGKLLRKIGWIRQGDLKIS